MDGSKSETCSAGVRHFTRDGEEWSVIEADTSHVPGAYAPRCLVFTGEAIVRRVWAFPPDWFDHSEESLLSILDMTPSAGASAVLGQLHPALIRAVVALREAQNLVRLAQAAVAANHALRSEEQPALDHCRASRTAVRTAVIDLAHDLNARGVAERDTRLLVRFIVGSEHHAANEPELDATLPSDIEDWCSLGYRVA